MKVFLKDFYYYKWIVPNVLKVREILGYIGGYQVHPKVFHI